MLVQSDFLPQLKMRGQRVRMNSNGDGEVDEDFWAQAAAEQAAGRSREDGVDDSKSLSRYQDFNNSRRQP